MTALVFVDTNIFVHRHDRSDPARQARAEEWIAHLARSRTGRLSFQVLQEFYVTLTGKARIGFDPAEAREIVRELAVWQPVAIDLKILERACISRTAIRCLGGTPSSSRRPNHWAARSC